MRKLFALWMIVLFVSMPLGSAAELFEHEDYDEVDTGESILINVTGESPVYAGTIISILLLFKQFIFHLTVYQKYVPLILVPQE